MPAYNPLLFPESRNGDTVNSLLNWQYICLFFDFCSLIALGKALSVESAEVGVIMIIYHAMDIICGITFGLISLKKFRNSKPLEITLVVINFLGFLILLTCSSVIIWKIQTIFKLQDSIDAYSSSITFGLIEMLYHLGIGILGLILVLSSVQKTKLPELDD